MRKKNDNVFYENHIHYDIELESAILGACLIESNAFQRIKGLLEENHFYSDTNKMVFKSLKEMWETGLSIDLLTVNSFIYKKSYNKDLPKYSPYYLTSITNAVTSSAHIETHAVFVRQLYVERLVMEIQASGGNGGDGIAKIISIQEMISKALNLHGTDDWRDMSAVMVSLVSHMEKVKGKDILGWSTGFNRLDVLTAGLQPSQLIIIGARPGAGKTSFAESIALGTAKQGGKVGIISLEMPDEQLGARFSSIESDIPFFQIYRNKMDEVTFERFIDKANELSSLPIFISSKTNVNANDIRSKAYKLNQRGGLDMLIIDYLQLIESDTDTFKNETRERQVAQISRSMKLLSMELKIPVVILCQLNRGTESNKDSEPRMHNLRESGALEQDADLVLLLHRPILSGITKDKDGYDTSNDAWVIIDKNRNGATTRLKLGFNGVTMKYYDPEETSSNYLESVIQKDIF